MITVIEASRKKDTARGRPVEVGVSLRVPKDKLNLLWVAEDALRELGISFDTGSTLSDGDSMLRNWEWDWSLSGPIEVRFRNWREARTAQKRFPVLFTADKSHVPEAREAAGPVSVKKKPGFTSDIHTRSLEDYAKHSGINFRIPKGRKKSDVQGTLIARMRAAIRAAKASRLLPVAVSRRISVNILWIGTEKWKVHPYYNDGIIGVNVSKAAKKAPYLGEMGYDHLFLVSLGAFYHKTVLKGRHVGWSVQSARILNTGSKPPEITQLLKQGIPRNIASFGAAYAAYILGDTLPENKVRKRLAELLVEFTGVIKIQKIEDETALDIAMPAGRFDEVHVNVTAHAEAIKQVLETSNMRKALGREPTVNDILDMVGIAGLPNGGSGYTVRLMGGALGNPSSQRFRFDISGPGISVCSRLVSFANIGTDDETITIHNSHLSLNKQRVNSDGDPIDSQGRTIETVEIVDVQSPDWNSTTALEVIEAYEDIFGDAIHDVSNVSESGVAMLLGGAMIRAANPNDPTGETHNREQLADKDYKTLWQIREALGDALIDHSNIFGDYAKIAGQEHVLIDDVDLYDPESIALDTEDEPVDADGRVTSLSEPQWSSVRAEYKHLLGLSWSERADALRKDIIAILNAFEEIDEEDFDHVSLLKLLETHYLRVNVEGIKTHVTDTVTGFIEDRIDLLQELAEWGVASVRDAKIARDEYRGEVEEISPSSIIIGAPKGMGSRMLAAQVAAGSRVGATSINCSAHRSSDGYVGYKVWGILGYDGFVDIESEFNMWDTDVVRREAQDEAVSNMGPEELVAVIDQMWKDSMVNSLGADELLAILQNLPSYDGTELEEHLIQVEEAAEAAEAAEDEEPAGVQYPYNKALSYFLPETEIRKWSSGKTLKGRVFATREQAEAALRLRVKMSNRRGRQQPKLPFVDTPGLGRKDEGSDIALAEFSRSFPMWEDENGGIHVGMKYGTHPRKLVEIADALESGYKSERALRAAVRAVLESGTVSLQDNRPTAIDEIVDRFPFDSYSYMETSQRRDTHKFIPLGNPKTRSFSIDETGEYRETGDLNTDDGSTAVETELRNLMNNRTWSALLEGENGEDLMRELIEYIIEHHSDVIEDSHLEQYDLGPNSFRMQFLLELSSFEIEDFNTGTGWDAEFSLAPGSVSMQIMREYIQSKQHYSGSYFFRYGASMEKVYNTKAGGHFEHSEIELFMAARAAVMQSLREQSAAG